MKRLTAPLGGYLVDDCFHLQEKCCGRNGVKKSLSPAGHRETEH